VLFTVTGASLAFTKGSQVCNDPTQRAAALNNGELPYVGCTRQLADVLDAQAQFIQEAVFKPVTNVVVQLLRVADELERVAARLDSLSSFLRRIERGGCLFLAPIHLLMMSGEDVSRALSQITAVQCNSSGGSGLHWCCTTTLKSRRL
jgi:hypothetical protein